MLELGTKFADFWRKIFNCFKEFTVLSFRFSLFKFDLILRIRLKNKNGTLLIQVKFLVSKLPFIFRPLLFLSSFNYFNLRDH